MRQKAFTLIELLAVIVILGLLIVIIAPKVTSTLKEAEKNTNTTSAENLIKAAAFKVSNNEMKGNNRYTEINYTTGENTDYLDYTGEKPLSGKMTIKPNGEIAMAVRFGDYCYLKRYNSNDISTIPYSGNTCDANTDIFINYELPELATTGDGLYEAQGESKRYIYRGANPNNHIWLDENGDRTKDSTEMYRIISYEPDGTIKVVREEKLFNKEWDEGTARLNTASEYYCKSDYGCNVWGSQSNTLYNGSALGDNFHYFYYASATDTTLSNGYSGKVETESTLNKYLNNGSWTDLTNLESYIDNHSWNVGGVYYTSNPKGLEKEKEEERQLTWTGKVGLMNITEYVETSLNPTCTSVRSNNGSSSGSPCKELNWTYKNYHQWSLSPDPGNNATVWLMYSTGYFNGNYGAYSAFVGVRPAFYLKSNIILAGEGTENNPYYIEEN